MFVCTCVLHIHMLFTKLISFQFRAFKKSTVQGSNLLNDVAAGIHLVLTGVAEGGELGNKAGMCSGC